MIIPVNGKFYIRVHDDGGFGFHHCLNGDDGKETFLGGICLDFKSDDIFDLITALQRLEKLWMLK